MCMFSELNPSNRFPASSGRRNGSGLGSRASALPLGDGGSLEKPKQRTKQAGSPAKPPRLNYQGGAPLNDAPLSEWNLHPIVDFGAIRQLDGQGDGAFGSRRRGGGRHGGIDIAVPPGTIVRAPAEGFVSRFDPYNGDPAREGKVDGLQITTEDGRILKVIYVEPDDDIIRAGFVRAGQRMGRSQTLQQVHPPTDAGPITEHIHFQVERRARVNRDSPFLVDPTEIVRYWLHPPKL